MKIELIYINSQGRATAKNYPQPHTSDINGDGDRMKAIYFKGTDSLYLYRDPGTQGEVREKVILKYINQCQALRRKKE